MNRTEMAKATVQWLSLVNTVMNIWVHKSRKSQQPNSYQMSKERPMCRLSSWKWKFFGMFTKVL